MNDAYFGKVPADRLVVRDRVLFFRGDGKHRSKIGLPPARALPVLGSYDAAAACPHPGAVHAARGRHRLRELDVADPGRSPFAGDVVNSYNDGPPAPGAKPLGPFYELETSSPAAALAPGASLVHRHRTLHFVGDDAALDARRPQGAGGGPGRDRRRPSFPGRRQVTARARARRAARGRASRARGETRALPGRLDPFRLMEPKDFVARRASSNNPDPSSNDDSQRPIPGETTVLADLEGPGAVTHIWITVAASEYGWPRLLRLRVYYDGSADAQRRRAARRLLRGGPRLRAARAVAHDPRQLRGPLAQQLLADALPEVVPHHGHQRGPPPRAQPLLPGGLAEAAVACRGTPPTSTPTTGRPCRTRAASPTSPERRGAAATTWARCCRWCRARRAGSARATISSTSTARRSRRSRARAPRTTSTTPGACTSARASTPASPWPRARASGSRMSAYRWHLTDPIPFQQSLRFDDGAQGLDLQARRRGEVGLRRADRPPVERRLLVPAGHRRGPAGRSRTAPPGCRRATPCRSRSTRPSAEVKAEKGKASLSPELFWSKDVLLFEAEGPGRRVEVPFDVPADGDYELVRRARPGLRLRHLHGPPRRQAAGGLAPSSTSPERT